MIKKIIFGLILIALLLFGYLLVNKKASAPGVKNQNNAAGGSLDSSTLAPGATAKYTINNQESIYFIVNKNRPLPAGYIPKNLVQPSVELIAGDNPEEQKLRAQAASAAVQLFDAADEEGYNLVMASGYRSATLQKFYYDNYVARDGQAAADKYSARPGTSEHQTGLALDITRADRKCYLEICFAGTAEGRWLAANAYKYGFTLRYKKGKENITGYQYEPWHFRYVGKKLAAELNRTGQTLEEFFKL